jgi:hypothetical protein
MNDLRTAAKQALEALEGGEDSWRFIGPAIDALKAALEQHSKDVEWMKERHANWRLQKELAEAAWNSALKQKPVAIALHTGTKQGIKWICRVDDGTPLYTHPPRREWRGLSEEEMKSTCADAWSYDPYVIARAIEAKLKELNHE